MLVFDCICFLVYLPSDFVIVPNVIWELDGRSHYELRSI